jgi:hypothetical protein
MSQISPNIPTPTLTASKMQVVKKQVVAVENPKVEGPKIKILVAVPACHVDHVKYREQVVDAIQANLSLNPNVEVTLSVCEEVDNSVAETNSWNVVVQKFQELSDRVVAENFDYLWIVEADVVVPPNALGHLLGDDVAVACSIMPFHFYEQNNRRFPVHKDMMITGFVLPDKNGNPTFDIQVLYLKDIKDKLLVGSKEHPIFNGTGCILIKRAVLEKIRWHWDNKVSGFDVYFWKEIQEQGFSAVTDGFVLCDHLGI